MSVTYDSYILKQVAFAHNRMAAVLNLAVNEYKTNDGAINKTTFDLMMVAAKANAEALDILIESLEDTFEEFENSEAEEAPNSDL